jgi:hypothetical protein
MLLRPKRRTLKSFVLRVLVPRAALFAVGALVLALGQVMAVNTSASSTSPAESGQVELPVWSAADQAAHPDCTPSSASSGKVADFVIVHSFRDDVNRRIDFDQAWGLNHNETEADDVWVLGVCGS